MYIRKPFSKEHKINIAKGHKGIVFSEERKKNMSNSLKGRKPSFLGKHHTKETKEKISYFYKGKIRENNNCWKGDNVGKRGVHKWIESENGKAKNYICKICQKKQAYDWANIDHKYKRDLKDYRALCKSCHKKWDYQFNKLK